MSLRPLLVLGAVYAVLGPAAAQEPAAGLAAFKQERAAAAKADPAADLSAADSLVAKAESILNQNPTAAGKLVREARWLLPAVPIGLPPHVEKVLGYQRLRHADRVNAVAYFPDGRRLASVGRDGTLRVWNLDNGRELAVYRDFPPPPADESKESDDVLRVPAVAIAPDGKLVAAAGGPEVHLWDPATGRARKLPAGKSSVWAVAFAPDGQSVATVAGDNIVRLWDVAAGKEVRAYPALTGRAEALAFAPDGTLAVVDAIGMLNVYAADKPDPKPTLSCKVSEGPDAVVRAVAFVRLERAAAVVTGGDDKLVRVTSLPPFAAGSDLGKYAGHTGRLHAVAAAGKLLLSAGEDKSVRVWDAESGRLLRQYQGHLGAVTALAVRADGKQFVSAAEDGGIRVWELSTSDDHRSTTDATDNLWAAAYSPDGKSFATAGADRTVRVHDAVTGKVLHVLRGHTAAVTSLAFLSDGRLASAGGDRVIRLWAAGDFQPNGTLDGHTSAVLALATGPNGRLLSGAADKTVRGWDTTTGKPAWQWVGRSPAAAVAVRPDGKRAAVGAADGTLTLLDLGGSEPKPLHTIAAHVNGVAAVAYDPAGSVLGSVGGDGHTKAWAVPTDGPPTVSRHWEPTARPAQPGGSVALSTVAFAPDGKSLAAAGAGGVVHVWSMVTGLETRALRGHADWVTAVAFPPSGDTLLAVGVDRSARVFDLPRADAVRPGHTAAARAVAVSRDGQWLFSGANDRTVKLWALPAGTETVTLPGPPVPTLPTLAAAFLDANTLAAGAEDGKLRTYRRNPPAELASSSPLGPVYAVTAAPDGKRFAVWARTQQPADQFRLYTPDLKLVGEPLVVKDGDIQCATFAPDLSRVAVGGEKGAVRVYDLATRERIGESWKAFPDAPVGDLAFTPDGSKLFVAAADGRVKVLDPAAREELAAGQAAAGVVGVVAAPSGDRFAVLGAGGGDVRVFDPAAKELRGWVLPVPANVAAFTPDGRKLITANADGTLYVLAVP